MYRPKDLRNRWPGLTLRKLALGIDDSINASSPSIINKQEAMTDFPKPYWHIATRYSESEKKITTCVACESLFIIDGEYKRPYRVKQKDNGYNTYNFRRILFKKSDILAYETRHTDEDDGFVFGESEDDGVEIVVPQKLLAGKTTKSTIAAMSAPEYGFVPSVIAYVLHYWNGVDNITELGKALREDRDSVTDSACAKYARKLLKHAESMDIVRGE